MNMLFTKDHLWIEVEGDIATVGLTEHASNCMENVLYVELPKSMQFVNKNDVVATIETENVDQEISSPLTGDVIESNELLIDSPDAVNNSAHEDAWLFKMYVNDETELEELMSEEEYQDFLYEQG